MHKNYDKILNIDTGHLGIVPNQSRHYNHYEATPYSILYTLFDNYELGGPDHFVDFGSGKGRVLFYVHYLFNIPVTGIEMNEKLHQATLQNKGNYIRKRGRRGHDIKAECSIAEEYQIQEIDNCFYLFNPFSVQIFMKIISNIMSSVSVHKRRVDLILYYPTTEYIHYLEAKTPFELFQEVQIPGLYQKNEHERFVIYRLLP